MITILATLSAKADKQKQLREVLLDVVAPSRAEAGCILYALHETEEHNGTFIFVEKWTDEVT